MLEMAPPRYDPDPWSHLSEAELAEMARQAEEKWEASGRRKAGLSALPAGIVLAAGLANIDFEGMSGAGRVETVAQLRRLSAHYEALAYAGMASIYDHLEAEFDGDVELATGAAAAEVRAALRLTRRSADVAVELALALASRLPALHQAFLDGKLDAARVKVVVSGTEHLDQGTARRVVEEVLPDAPQLTTGQLAARLRRLCVEVDADDAVARYEAAHEDRKVELRPDPTGTGHVFAFDLDPFRASQGMRHVDQLARSLKVDGETRSMDQLRADVFLDLLCGQGADAGTDRGTSAPTTHVTVDLPTLIGLDEHAGELAGFGPIVADLARRAATASRRWEYSIRDGDTGEVIAAGTTRRRPTAAQQHAVRAADQQCVFPGCRMPAVDCDLDHIDDYASGGRTTKANLAPACRHDHRLKHEYGWTYRRLPNGNHEWTSRLGVRHTTGPP